MLKHKLFFSSLMCLCLYAPVLLSEQDHGHDHAEMVDAKMHEQHAVNEQDQAQAHNEAEQDKHDEHDEENESRVQLTDEQRLAAGIVIEALSRRDLASEIEAPGEIRLNAYASSQITPRIEAQVIERHARLGDSVRQGQALVTLSSVAMAEAQGQLLITAKEWQRVKRLGKKVVSEKRYLETKITYQQSQAKLLAYGLTKQQVKALLGENDIDQANGHFTLLASQNGTVIADDFVIGQMINPGDLLFKLTDESTLWIEARVKPEFMSDIKIGASARVKIDGAWLDGKVVQIHHALDETTRTLAVRLEIGNPGDQLHPGQFVLVSIASARVTQAALVLPQNAVLRRPDGDWQVFVEHQTGIFEAREIELLDARSGLARIEGLAPGTRVVTQGAFFIQSELAKSGFDVHNH